MLLLMFSCDNTATNSTSATPRKPLVDIQNPQQSVAFLCDLHQKLSISSLSDEEYKKIQIEIEALYLGFEFGVNAGFYSDEDLLQIADSLGCVI